MRRNAPFKKKHGTERRREMKEKVSLVNKEIRRDKGK